MSISAIDLFCGVGGLSHGIQNSGIKVLAGVDLDESCKYAYTANNNALFIHKSVKDLDSNELIKLYPENDIKILMGCAPCQPFSSHQKNKYDRSQHKDWDLLNSFAKHIENIQPDIVSMENVPDLENESVFGDFKTTLINNGYSVTYKIVNAADYGVPQRRRRLLLLASKLGEIEFINPTHLDNPITIFEAIGNLEPIAAGEQSTEDPLHRASALSDLNIQRIQASKQGGTWKDWDESLLPNCYKKESGASYSSVYGRMKWDEVSPTLTTQFIRYGTGRYGHPEQDRGLSLREGAILQSFPEDYKFVENSKYNFTSVAKHIGNAVPVKLGEVIGKSINNHLMKYSEVQEQS